MLKKTSRETKNQKCDEDEIAISRRQNDRDETNVLILNNVRRSNRVYHHRERYQKKDRTTKQIFADETNAKRDVDDRRERDSTIEQEKSIERIFEKLEDVDKSKKSKNSLRATLERIAINAKDRTSN